MLPTTTVPQLSFRDGLKLFASSRKLTSFYFDKTDNLMKKLSQKYGVWGKKVVIDNRTWFMFQFKLKRTIVQVFVRGSGANQMVMIKKA